MQKSFKHNVNLLLINPVYLQDYYMFLKAKLVCDKSLSIVEQDIFSSFYDEFFSRQEDNHLLNTKILLYREKIKPIYLNISVLDTEINKNILLIVEISKTKSPTVMLERYLHFIELNRELEHDALLNILVFSILKSGIKNFKLIALYIKTYRRRIFIFCEHRKKQNESEVEYYIQVLQIALEFIERMEFKDLNLSKSDYDTLIGLN